MSSRKKLFVWFNHDQGKYLMVSEWTSNQDNSSLLLLLTIGKGNDWNIIKYHGDFLGKFSQWWKVTITLDATWLASRHYS